MRDIGPLSGGFIPAEETDDKGKRGGSMARQIRVSAAQAWRPEFNTQGSHGERTDFQNLASDFHTVFFLLCFLFL